MDVRLKNAFKEITIILFVFLGVAAMAFWQIATSFAEQGANTGGPFNNAAMFPRLIASIIVVLGLIQIGISFVKIRTMPAETLEAGKGFKIKDHGLVDPQLPDEAPRTLLFRALGCLAVFIVYLMLVTTTGYLLATVLMLMLMFTILGTSPLVACVVAVTATLAVGFVFDTLLSVVLPVGQLGLPTLF